VVRRVVIGNETLENFFAGVKVQVFDAIRILVSKYWLEAMGISEDFLITAVVRLDDFCGGLPLFLGHFNVAEPCQHKKKGDSNNPVLSLPKVYCQLPQVNFIIISGVNGLGEGALYICHRFATVGYPGIILITRGVKLANFDFDVCLKHHVPHLEYRIFKSQGGAFYRPPYLGTTRKFRSFSRMSGAWKERA